MDEPRDAVARLNLSREAVREFCSRHHIKRLGLFGSVLRPDFNAQSDVDVLYEFQEGRHPGWDIVSVQEELSRLIGRPVDFVPFRYLNRHIRDRVLKEAKVVYDAA